MYFCLFYLPNKSQISLFFLFFPPLNKQTNTLTNSRDNFQYGIFLLYIMLPFFPMRGGYCGENDILKLSHRNPIVKTVCFNERNQGGGIGEHLNCRLVQRFQNYN